MRSGGTKNHALRPFTKVCHVSEWRWNGKPLPGPPTRKLIRLPFKPFPKGTAGAIKGLTLRHRLDWQLNSEWYQPRRVAFQVAASSASGPFQPTWLK
jgi:hypothetical protein